MRQLVLGAALAAAVSTAVFAASATGGTLTAANTEANPLVLNVNAGDTFPLTIDLPAGYADQNPQTYIRLLFSGTVNAGEKVLADTATGDPNDATAHWANGHALSQGVDQVILVADSGVRNTVVNTSGSGPVTVSIALTHIPDDPGDPNLPYAAHGNAPRFAKYTPKNFPGLGLDYSEPTVGFDPRSGDVFSINTLDVLRTTFDDSTVPAQDTWVSRHANESSVVTLDPILFLDQGTGRVFSLNLSGPISTADFSDDDGETWLPGGNGFPTSGVDHETLGAGPYPATGIGALIPHPLYANAVYYCSQGIADAYCSRSDDGGVNFNPARTIYLNAQCTGLHGHVKVAPDGTVYVPNRACGLDQPTFGNGSPALIVSEDAGVTWTVRLVPPDTTAVFVNEDPSVAIGRDGTIYFSYLTLDGHIHVTMSQDHGQTWSNNNDLAPIVGVHAAKFPAVVAGDAGRAAVTFLGTSFPTLLRSFSGSGVLANMDQPDENMEFPGVFYAYVASTFDYGAHWFVTKVAPDDIIQGPKGIGGSGDNRNLLDFNDATIDSQGRILAVFADGCVGGCSAGSQGHSTYFMRVAQLFRQSGGPRMFAAFDPVEPAVPPPPRVTGYRTKDYSVLTIDADNGGSPITGYNLFRNGTAIATNLQGAKFVDLTANDPTAVYRYSATAINALGESAQGNSFGAVVDDGAPITAAVCTLPGQLHLDQVNEPGAELAPGDIVNLGIAEPEDQPGKLVFTAQMRAPTGSAKIGFDHPDGRRYVIQVDASGATSTYTDGRWFNSTQDQLADDLFELPGPAIESNSADNTGALAAVIDKATWNLKTGDELKNIRVIGEQFGGNGRSFLRDYLGYDLTQPIVGNDFCAKGAHLPPPNLPVVTPTPTPSTSGGDSKRFGGAMGLLTLLPMLGFALQRRIR